MNRIDSRELSEWVAYSTLEPFGPHHEDLRAGIVASVSHNAWCGKESQVRQPHDWFPHIKALQPDQTPEQQAAILQFTAAAAGK